MKLRSLAALTLFGLLLASAVSAQTINKCQAGKKKCVGQAVKRLLVCHAKAEAKGDPVDQSCLDKVLEKFSHPSDNKGCIEKVEAKGGCSTFNNAAVLAAQIDAFVLDAVQNLDPGYPVAVLNKCSADKKKCVAKGAAKLLGCHAKADTKGELDPNCLIKRRQAFDGSLLLPPDAGKGCFEKVEAKETPEAICLTHDDTATLEAKIDAFVTDVVCVLTPAGDPQIDPQAFDACQPGCGGAHCVPTALLGSLPVSPATCTAAGGAAGACVPDPVIAEGGQFVPATCVSIAGAEGRCLSTCLPDVAARADELPQDGCAADERCMPCFDPTASHPTAPTGACGFACDEPTDPPVELSCPWNGPQVFNPTAFAGCGCGGAHCVPAGILPSLPVSPANCTAAGGAAGECVPDAIIAGGGQVVPATCTSIAGAEGRCLSTCLPEVAARAATLPQSGCAADERCVPCFDPTASDPTAPTGACGFACDEPTDPPVELSCPWTGPDVYNPSVFAGCSPSCGGAHCVPTEIVGSGLQDLLAACPGGFCVPDPIIRTAGNLDPLNCVAFAGTTAAGRCLSTCLPDIAAQPSLEAPAICGGNKCAPCADPFTGADTGACGSLGCDQLAPTPAFTFPGCCGNLGVCVPKSQIPDALEADFGQRDCPNTTGSIYLCLAPGQISGSGVTPTSCNVDFSILPPFSWVSVCVPNCVLGGDIAPFLPQANCPVNWSCPPPE